MVSWQWGAHEHILKQVSSSLFRHALLVFERLVDRDRRRHKQRGKLVQAELYSLVDHAIFEQWIMQPGHLCQSSGLAAVVAAR
jgi:hypothetical protein